MMRLAESIIRGQPQPELVGIGQPLVMIPWILLIKPFSELDFSYFDIAAPLVLINGFVLGGLSVMVVGGIARHVTRDDRVAAWSAALWALAPLLTYFAFFWHFDPVLLRSANVPKIGWLNGLSDGPAIFYMLVPMLLLAQIESGRAQATTRRMMAIGALFGAAVAFRVHVAPVVGFLLVYILAAHGWRSLLAACAGGLIAYLPQAWYNQTVFGLPITSGYISRNDAVWNGTLNRPLSDIIGSLPFHPKHIAELMQYFVGRRPWLLLPLGLLLIAAMWGTTTLWRQRGWRAVALLIGAPMAYMVPMMLAWPFRYDVIRFSMLTFPFALILAVYLGWWAWDRIRARSEEPRQPASGSVGEKGSE
jgi:hypothetical protein